MIVSATLHHPRPMQQWAASQITQAWPEFHRREQPERQLPELRGHQQRERPVRQQPGLREHRRPGQPECRQLVLPGFRQPERREFHQPGRQLRGWLQRHGWPEFPHRQRRPIRFQRHHRRQHRRWFQRECIPESLSHMPAAPAGSDFVQISWPDLSNVHKPRLFANPFQRTLPLIRAPAMPINLRFWCQESIPRLVEIRPLSGMNAERGGCASESSSTLYSSCDAESRRELPELWRRQTAAAPTMPQRRPERKQHGEWRWCTDMRHCECVHKVISRVRSGVYVTGPAA